MRTAEQNHLVGGRERLSKDLPAPIAWRNAGLPTLDDGLKTRLRVRPRWRGHDDVLQSAKGMGPVSAHTVRLDLPELGTLTRQQSAAWVGVAPLHGDRGTLRGKRAIWGGRAGTWAPRVVPEPPRGDPCQPADANLVSTTSCRWDSQKSGPDRV